MIDEIAALYEHAIDALARAREDAIENRDAAQIANNGVKQRTCQAIVYKINRAQTDIADTLADILRDAKAVSGVK